MRTQTTLAAAVLLAAGALVVWLASSGGLTTVLAQNKKPDPEPAKDDWRENYAYTLGVQAYIYGFPYVYMSEVRWGQVAAPVDPEVLPHAALNHFWHNKVMGGPESQAGGSPNNDTLYSIAWLDLSKEPVILSVPDVGDRYYTMEIASFDSDNFAYVGMRTTGTKAGDYAIVGPSWKGELPSGVKQLTPSRTPSAFILGRTLLRGPDDLPAIRALMVQYKLTPLSLWGKPDAKVPESHDVFKPFDRKTDPLAGWKTMNKAMTENPPPSRHELLLKQFAQIGIGPRLDVEKLDEATKRGLARAAVDGRKLLDAALRQGARQKNVNGWNYPPPEMGRAGDKDDFLLRAALQSMWGIVANDPAEAVYLNTSTDPDGQQLTGANRYVMHFPDGGLPKVKAFWSITLYDARHNLVANPLKRYALGDRDKLKFNGDGSLDIYIQNESPGGDREANWLPAPKEDFNLVLRSYLPGAEIQEQRWTPPAINKVK
ncbi:MAG TPA: DUF1254 domain-containing protein [Gemmataceae bacterium]|nr:DUF1254 domain-containing protein [Gemmataceae bacterium]